MRYLALAVSIFIFLAGIFYFSRSDLNFLSSTPSSSGMQRLESDYLFFKRSKLAVGLVACGPYAYESILETALKHIRMYSDNLPVLVYTDMPQCFEGLDVRVIHGGNCTTRFGSNMGKQEVLSQLLKQHDKVLYLDSDVLVTKNFRRWVRNLPYVAENSIVFARERGGLESAVSGGAMLLSNNSARCLGQLHSFMTERYDSDAKRTYSDQKSYMLLTQLQEADPAGCRIGLMEPLTMCFSHDNDWHCVLNLVLAQLGMVINSATVFMHYTNEVGWSHAVERILYLQMPLISSFYYSLR